MEYGYQDALAYSGIAEAHPGGFSLTKRILSKEGIKPGSVILDAGCGMGLTSSYLARELKCQVYALDIHPQMLVHANDRLKKENLKVNLVKGSMENMPFQDHFFDRILTESSTVFTNIPVTLKEYFRVIKQDGILICIEMAAEEELEENEKEKIKQLYDIDHFPTEKEWLEAFEKAGFNKVEILKSNTILEELEEYEFLPEHYDGVHEEQAVNPAIEEVLKEHARFTMEYAELLGYRVFRVKK